MKIENNILSGDPVKLDWIKCEKHGGPLQADTIVIHYTGGESAASSAQWLCDSNVQASAHIVIDRADGAVYQLVPFDVVAWHAGESTYAFPDGTTRTGFNQYSIGIELDNAGPLQKTSGGYQAWFGRYYKETDTFYGTHKHESQPRYWLTFSEVQIQRLREICSLLVARYEIKYVLGHDDVAPSRKIDPGPAFPMDELRRHLLSADRHRNAPDVQVLNIGHVTADALNIRSGPSPNERLVAEPLLRNKSVQVLERKAGWYRVRTEIEGWVNGNYVELQRGNTI